MDYDYYSDDSRGPYGFGYEDDYYGIDRRLKPVNNHRRSYQPPPVIVDRPRRRDTERPHVYHERENDWYHGWENPSAYDRPRSYSPDPYRRDTGHDSRYRRGPPPASTLACHPYNEPRGVDGHDLAKNVNLFGFRERQDSDADQYGSWNWTDKQGHGTSRTQPERLLEITVARRWFDTEGQHLLDLTCGESSQHTHQDQSYPIRWLYGSALAIASKHSC